ncbi:GerAB/ArcD/ProY family transporter [Paenibacillus pini]|uniref:Spore germination protein n=1 Tax=Paenibacillus pini JCM 16418 TaxID=1236976 RepID=W7Z7M4_9BACL|nr:endospore germination permease [Paenibacillus pini]GAF10404.1 spore germination protein [Paenibacillus pini JCM 16418]
MAKINQLQIYMLYSLYLFTSTIGFLIGPIIKKSHYSSWVSIFIGAILGLILTYGSFLLAMRRPTQFFSSYGKKIMGRWIHYPLMVFMIFAILCIAAFILRELQDLVIQVYLPDTPQWAVSSLFGICIAYAVRSGIESIFRAAQGIFFFTIAGILFIPFIVSKEINYDMAIAFLNHMELAGITNGSFLIASLFGEMAFIVFVMPYIISNEKTMKSLTWATITSIFIILANLLPVILVFGPELPSNLTYPEFELLRFAKTSTFLENLDPLLIAIWLSSLFIKISLLIFAATAGLTHIFSLKDHKPFSFVITALVVGLSLTIVRTQTELNHLLEHGWIPFVLISETIPLFYLLVDWLRSLLVKRS